MRCLQPTYNQSAQDYYPFGMIMPSRNFNTSTYRFGFNGQEKDDEITGQTGSHTTALFWEYDTRIGRRWNVDPVPQISISDYACFINNPIFMTDPNGDRADGFTIDNDGKIEKVDNTGRDPNTGINNYDVLYNKDEYNNGNKKYDNNGTGKNGIKIKDTKLIPGLINEKGNANQTDWITRKPLPAFYTFSNNGEEALSVFKFLGKNQSDEWTLEGYKGNKWILGSVKENAQGLNVQKLKIAGFETANKRFDYHSHNGLARFDFTPSDLDIFGANQERKSNPNVKFYIYSPQLNKKNWNEVFPNNKINYEPAKMLPY